MRDMRAPTNQLPLTDFEGQVLQELAIGRTYRDRDELAIAETTVTSHVRATLDKLGVRSRTQAAVQAHQWYTLLRNEHWQPRPRSAQSASKSSIVIGNRRTRLPVAW
jgi:DNA-binding CsgD family transcriptional regulator